MLTVLSNIRSTKVLWLMEDNLQWKTPFGGRRPLAEDNLRWKTSFVGSLHAAYSALQHFSEEDPTKLVWKDSSCLIRNS